MIELRHPLAVLSTRMRWSRIEAALEALTAHKARTGVAVGDVDLFGPTTQLVGAGVRPRGRQSLPVRADGGAAVPEARLQRERRIAGGSREFAACA